MDLSRLAPEDYPILSDLYDLIEAEYENPARASRKLYTPELLREILLGLHSMCHGVEVGRRERKEQNARFLPLIHRVDFGAG
jgi:hypothetical protein